MNENISLFIIGYNLNFKYHLVISCIDKCSIVQRLRMIVHALAVPGVIEIVNCN